MMYRLGSNCGSLVASLLGTTTVALTLSSRAKRGICSVLFLAAATAGAQTSLGSGGSYDPIFLVRTGQYDSATKLLLTIPRSDSAWIQAQKWLALTHLTVGKYDEAERVAKAATQTVEGMQVANTYGEILMARGKRAEAETVFVRAISMHAPDSLTAKLNLAVLHFDRGDREKAYAEFDSFIDVYNNALPVLTSQDLVDVAVAVQYLGAKDWNLFKDALKALDRAIAIDPDNIDAKILIGELFLLKFNSQEAQNTFEEVLRINPRSPRALIGAARRLEFDNLPGADSLLKVALSVNADFVPARLFLAGQMLDVEDYKAAQTEIDRVLRLDPTSREALAMSATIKYLTGDKTGYDAVRQRAFQLNAKDGDFYVAMGDAAERVRQYETAVEFAREGVKADSLNWNAWGLMGHNLLRTGKVDEGHAALQTSFKGDPYNIWIKNTLDLLDTYKNYDTFKTPHSELMVEKTEAQILGVYLGDLVEDAYTTFEKRYGFTPKPPIRIEVYRSHADFSVRTTGMGGIGALGVSFGTTLAFDSPAAKDAGPFNWGSTVWHELAHTFTLGLTDHKVPRWFSEGLSVYEEHLAKPGWGFQMSPSFLNAFSAGKLMPVSRLNDGFMRPQYPQQVQFSYYQASLVCELIARDFGPQALVAMLNAYKAGQSTEQVFASVLKTDIKAFDKRFDDYMKQRFAGPIAALKGGDSAMIDQGLSTAELLTKAMQNQGSYVPLMIAARALMERNEDSAAVPLLEKARTLIPDYAGEASPYPALVKIYQARNDTTKLIGLLEKIINLGEYDYDAHIALATLLQAKGRAPEAAAVLERAMYINPFDMGRHQQLAGLFEAIGDKQKVVRERRAIVALNPVDRAQALYQLALAYESANDVAGAKKAVLRALEEAPNFDKALDLLLKLHGGDK